jgi:hypothetical protein
MFDISFCPLTSNVLSELAPDEGIKQLIEAYDRDKDEMRDILRNLCQDINFRIKLKGSMPHRIILGGEGKDKFEHEFLRRAPDGTIEIPDRRKLLSTKALMEHGYANVNKFYTTVLRDKRVGRTVDGGRRDVIDGRLDDGPNAGRKPIEPK